MTLRYMTDAEVEKRFGKLPLLLDRDGKIITSAGGQVAFKPENKWMRENIGRVYIPELKGMLTYGEAPNNKMSGWVACHRGIAGNLVKAFQEIKDLKLMHLVVFWGGCMSFRLVRGSKDQVSRHAYGIAFDINPQQNPLAEPPAEEGEFGSLTQLIPIFEKHGFINGGQFTRQD